jgi:hypothetical protein
MAKSPVEDQPCHDAKVKMDEQIELKPGKFSAVEPHGSEVVQYERRGEEREMERVERQPVTRKIHQPENRRENRERPLISAAGRRGKKAQRDENDGAGPCDSFEPRVAVLTMQIGHLAPIYAKDASVMWGPYRHHSPAEVYRPTTFQ